MGIIFSIIAGLLLRLICIDKAEGLWNDEYISWFIASQPFTKEFWEAVYSQCHMPFYYLYLKFVMSVFGQSDLVLRLSSVFTGLCSIVAMYFAGLEKDKKTGLIASIFTALSGFLIYYSQEVRIYSVLFLFSALSLIFTLKITKNPDKKNLAGLIISDFLILFTHTIGFVYVFFNILYLSVILFKKFKKGIICLWSTLFVLGFFLSPFFIKIFSTQSFAQWWGSFSIAKLGFLFTDYFSPYLTNLVNSPDTFFYHPSAGFFIFCIIPTVIAIFWVIKSVLKSNENRSLLGICAGVIFVLVVASLFGKLVFITKYSIEIYPILIYLAAYGAEEVKNTKLKNSLIILYCFLAVAYIFVSPISAPRIKRAQGHKIPAELIKHAELKKGDYIILEYYPQNRFEKYADFGEYNVISIDKGNFPSYLSLNINYYRAYKEGKTLYRQTFMSDRNLYLQNQILESVIKKLKPNQNVLVIMMNGVAFYSPETIQQITNNDILYDKTPLLFLVFSHIKNQVFEVLSQNLSINRFESRGDWSAIKFTKLNNMSKN